MFVGGGKMQRMVKWWWIWVLFLTIGGVFEGYFTQKSQRAQKWDCRALWMDCHVLQGDALCLVAEGNAASRASRPLCGHTPAYGHPSVDIPPAYRRTPLKRGGGTRYTRPRCIPHNIYVVNHIGYNDEYRGKLLGECGVTRQPSPLERGGR